MKLIIFVLGLSLTSIAFGTCKDLESCVNQIGKITGKKYIYSEKLKGDIKTTSDIEFTKKNGGKFLSWILYRNGYSRIPLDEVTYSLIKSRDIRYNVVPDASANANTPPNLPDTYDYFMMVYTTKSPHFTTSITRALRPFMSRYGRVIDAKGTSKLVVQDTGINLKRIYRLIKDMDVKPSKKMIKVQMKIEKERKELRRIEAKSCKNYITELEVVRATCNSNNKS